MEETCPQIPTINSDGEIAYSRHGLPILYHQRQSAQSPGFYSDLDKPIVAWHMADVLERRRVGGHDINPLFGYLAGLDDEQRRELDQEIDRACEGLDDDIADLLGILSERVIRTISERAGLDMQASPMIRLGPSDVFDRQS